MRLLPYRVCMLRFTVILLLLPNIMSPLYPCPPMFFSTNISVKEIRIQGYVPSILYLKVYSHHAIVKLFEYT